jgi:AcrR family transcriptional regulator
MGRRLKGYDERRTEILDGAWELFTQRGYAATTVAKIISRLDISKGTFYHYFTSKEEVLNAIADRLATEPLEELRPIVDDATIPAIPKLNRYLAVARAARLRRMDSLLETARVLYREDNLVIRHKISQRMVVLTKPGLKSIIDQGLAEGCFHVSNADEAANFFLLLSNTFADQQMQTLLGDQPVETKVVTMVSRADFVIDSLERILGAKPGSLNRPSPQTIALFVRAVSEADGSATE